MRAGPALDICGTPPSFKLAKSRLFGKKRLLKKGGIITKMAQMSHLTFAWCPRQDLNLYALRHMLLRHACIPISPLGLLLF